MKIDKYNEIINKLGDNKLVAFIYQNNNYNIPLNDIDLQKLVVKETRIEYICSSCKKTNTHQIKGLKHIEKCGKCLNIKAKNFKDKNKNFDLILEKISSHLIISINDKPFDQIDEDFKAQITQSTNSWLKSYCTTDGCNNITDTKVRNIIHGNPIRCMDCTNIGKRQLLTKGNNDSIDLNLIKYRENKKLEQQNLKEKIKTIKNDLSQAKLDLRNSILLSKFKR